MTAHRRFGALDEQLRQSQKMEAVGRLAGGVAHDFNNMLTVILGHTELALDRPDLSSSLRATLTQVQRAGQHLADLTRQLLAFARQQTVTPKVLDLNETISGMLTMLQRLIGEDVRIAWMPGDQLGNVRIDPTQMDQILANLCVNARDAIAGIGQITIETRHTSFDEAYCARHVDYLPGSFLRLSIRDNGRGIPPETLPYIFEPFFTTKGVGEGTGLGLATVFGIVKQNDGFITVESLPGVGTTFRIYLPEVPVAASDQFAGYALRPPSDGPCQ